MYDLMSRTGCIGEYNIPSTNKTDEIVAKIKNYELSFNDRPQIFESNADFVLKNIGITVKSDSDVTVYVNDRPFVISSDYPLNLPYFTTVSRIIFDTASASVSIRYIY